MPGGGIKTYIMREQIRKMKLKPIHGIIIAVIAILFIGITAKQTPNNELDNMPSAYSGLAFTLQSNKGDVSLSDFQGKWVLIYVGYTFCPDVCPTNLGSLSQAYQKLSAKEKDKIQILLVSVDPDRDTPARLAEYSKYFEMNMIGLTGKIDKLDKLAKDLGAAYKINKNEGKHYSVDHSAYTYIISPRGKLIEQLPHGIDSQQFLTKIQQVINNEEN